MRETLINTGPCRASRVLASVSLAAFYADELDDVLERFPGAVEEAAGDLTQRGFAQVRQLIGPLIEGFEER